MREWNDKLRVVGIGLVFGASSCQLLDADRVTVGGDRASQGDAGTPSSSGTGGTSSGTGGSSSGAGAISGDAGESSDAGVGGTQVPNAPQGGSAGTSLGDAGEASGGDDESAGTTGHSAGTAGKAGSASGGVGGDVGVAGEAGVGEPGGMGGSGGQPPLACQNGGIGVTLDNQIEVCDCPVGTWGETCELGTQRIFAMGGGTCAEKTNGLLTCWGRPAASAFVPPGPWLTLKRWCGLRTDHTIDCFTDMTRPGFLVPSGTFLDFDAYTLHGCGVRTDGTLTCWGEDVGGSTVPPSGTFTNVSVGYGNSCALATDGTVSAGALPVTTAVVLCRWNHRRARSLASPPGEATISAE
jgi:hypothetical protein